MPCRFACTSIAWGSLDSQVPQRHQVGQASSLCCLGMQTDLVVKSPV